MRVGWLVEIIVASYQHDIEYNNAFHDYRTEYMRRRYRLFWTSVGI